MSTLALGLVQPPWVANMSVAVFGGRSPIALAICRDLSQAGKEVLLFTRSRDAEILELASASQVKEVISLDLSETESSVAVVDELEGDKCLDGVVFSHRYRDLPDADAEFRTDVLTPHAILEKLASRQREHECSVVFLTSPAGASILTDQPFGYHAVKAAQAQLVRFAAVHFGKKGLRTNGVSPGSFVYKQRAASFYAANTDLVKFISDTVPVGRMANVQEIACSVTFLLDEKSKYLNGQILEVDGGISCYDPASLARDVYGNSATMGR